MELRLLSSEGMNIVYGIFSKEAIIITKCYIFCYGFTVPFSVLQIITFSVTDGFIPFAHKIESSTRYHLKACPASSVGS
jgi:hypothetical protein